MLIVILLEAVNLQNILFQYLLETLKELDLESNGNHCKGPIAEIPKKRIEVIDTRNIKPPERCHIANVLIPQDQISADMHSSSQSIKVVEALCDQVQSLHDTVNILEQRLTILEEAIKK